MCCLEQIFDFQWLCSGLLAHSELWVALITMSCYKNILLVWRVGIILGYLSARGSDN